MYSKIKSCGVLGIDGYIVEIETDIGNGLPAFDIVGLGDTAIREARTCPVCCQKFRYEFPIKNNHEYDPANIKEGSSFDRPLRWGSCIHGQHKPAAVKNSMFIGNSRWTEVKP